MKRNITPILLVLLGFIISVTSNAQVSGDYRSNGAVSVAAATNWQTWNGTSWIAAVAAPVGTSGTPFAKTMTIQASHILTVPNATPYYISGSLIVENTAAIEFGGNSASTLNISGTADFQGTSARQAYNTSGGAQNQVVFAGNSTFKSANVNGIFGVDPAATTIQNTSNNKLLAVFPTTAPYVNIELSGTSAQSLTGVPANVNNLTISGGSTKTMASSITVNGNLALGSGNTLDKGSNTLTVVGDITGGGTITGTTPTTFASGNHTLAAGGSYGDISVTGGTLDLGNGSGSLQLNSMTVGNGVTLNIKTNVNVAGNWNNGNGSTVNHNSNKVKFNGSTAQTITVTGGGTQTFYDLEIANTSGGVSIGASTNVSVLGTTTFTSGAFTVGSGRTFTAADNQTIVMAGGTVSNSGTLQYGTTSGTNLNFSAGTYSSPTVLSPNGAGSKIKNLTVSGATLTTSASALTLEGYVALSSGSLTLGGNLSLKGNFDVTGGTFTPGNNTVIFNGTTAQSINPSGLTSASFYGVTVNNTAGVTMGSNTTVNNALTLTSGKLSLGGFTATLGGTITGTGTFSGGTTSSINLTGSGGTLYFDQTTNKVTNSLQNFTVGATTTATLGNTLNVSGTLTPTSGGTLNTGGNLVITSDASGTGRILSLTGFTLSGNVTVERYIPAKSARKWDYVTFAIAGPTQTFRNAWQDEIFISGTGTGGSVCGSTSGNGSVSTDKYNTNGFDVVPVTAPTIYTYNQANATNNRWIPITSTLTDYIQAGKGYRLNVRGDRTAVNACTNQLNTSGTITTTAVTLKVTGTITSGNVPVTVDGGTPNGYTLLGNPYPCELDFSAFRTSNSSVITNKYWTYSPENASNIFTAYNAGTVTNGGTNINNTNGHRIASGQSFFVESAAGGTVTFTEAHKTSGVQIGAFRTYDWKNKIRIGYAENNNSQIDEVVIRFSNESGVTINENEFDAISFNSGNHIAALKGTKAFAISTRPSGFVNDTVALKVLNSVAGSYKLNFSEFDNFTEASQIILIDEYAGTQTNVKSNPVYSFSITSDAASQGSNRFKIVFKGSVALPVSSLSINATTKSNGVEVSWVVSSDETINNYVVEKSSNGRDFSSIGSVQSRTSNYSTSYNFLDVQSLTGVTYYRVKSNDKSGIAKYSSVVKMKPGKSEVVMSAYPNPVKDQLNLIIINGDSYTKATAVIRNAQGRSVLQQTVKSTNGNFSIDVNTLAPGMYFITIVNEKGESLVEKFIKY